MSIDWRKIGKVIWIDISKYLGYMENMVLYKPFGLVKPDMPILDMVRINNLSESLWYDSMRQYEQKRDEAGGMSEEEDENERVDEDDEGFSMARLTRNVEAYARDLSDQRRKWEIDGQAENYKKFLIEEAFTGKEKLYIPLGKATIKEISEISKQYKVSIQCPKCKNYNLIIQFGDKTKYNGQMFKCLTEAFTSRNSIIYQNYLCTCMVKNWKNTKVEDLPSNCLFDVMIHDFFKVHLEK